MKSLCFLDVHLEMSGSQVDMWIYYCSRERLNSSHGSGCHSDKGSLQGMTWGRCGMGREDFLNMRPWEHAYLVLAEGTEGPGREE